MHIVKSSQTQSRSGIGSLRPLLIHPQKIAVRTQEGLLMVSWQDIIRCEADSNYTWIFLQQHKSLLVCKTLGRVQAALPDNYFVRVHQSHLLRLDEISAVTKETVDLRDGTQVPLARNSRHLLIERLQTISTFI